MSLNRSDLPVSQSSAATAPTWCQRDRSRPVLSTGASGDRSRPLQGDVREESANSWTLKVCVASEGRDLEKRSSVSSGAGASHRPGHVDRLTRSIRGAETPRAWAKRVARSGPSIGPPNFTTKVLPPATWSRQAATPFLAAVPPPPMAFTVKGASPVNGQDCMEQLEQVLATKHSHSLLMCRSRCSVSLRNASTDRANPAT
mmetsp:Transcript_94059/g.255386  ORF Transcript_94059/g.255386 Transcript_94059/m.255386 type:complete len:201 (-) Transcript_94059:107-709(-)